MFLNFRGSDTRFGFTGNLYKALHDRGFQTFIDDEKHWLSMRKVSKAKKERFNHNIEKLGKWKLALHQVAGKIETICLEFPIFDKEMVEWNRRAFKKMKNLKTLIIKGGNFSKDPKYLPNSLRVLKWWRYPSCCLPSDFHPKKLAICKLPYSSFTSFELDGLWKASLKILNFDWCKCLTKIPDNVYGLSNLEELAFKHCKDVVRVHNSIGFLDKLKRLSATNCTKLRSFPPLKLTSLKELDLSFCSTLERFPEILCKMENITRVWFFKTPIKELPFSFQNLIGLEILGMSDCEIVRFPSSIVMMPKLTHIVIPALRGWQWLKREEGEEKVCSIVSSKIEKIWASNCNLNDDFFFKGYPWFAHVKVLKLSNNNFTILPEFIKECQNLLMLSVCDCKYLQEIRGIPPNLKHFFARKCKSLTSLSRSMFLNQELHEAGNTTFYLPGTRIPE
ncbi:TMV resistance protein N [Glycine soja]|uniref:TMV resistance protein N n=1 Tax=Glycine soja TaxID=3848 RepID=A0A0B2SMN0_GLYSO|nr:TMV resistance protein N [Glycine soja]